QDGEERVRAERKPHEPDDRGGVLRVAAEAIKAAGDEAVGAAIGVAQPEIEIAAHRDEQAAEAEWQRDDVARPIEQRRRVPVERGDDEDRKPAAAKQAPEGKVLPAAGFRRRPDAEGRSEKSPEQ